MGSDAVACYYQKMPNIFQSTPPAWGATEICPVTSAKEFISIHAPPHGERRENRLRLKPNGYISIHAPRMGSDRASLSVLASPRNFNPRPPHGERHLGILLIRRPGFISIHAPAWGATITRVSGNSSFSYFIPRSRRGSDSLISLTIRIA